MQPEPVPGSVVLTDVSSLTGRSHLLEMALTSPRASGHCIFVVHCPRRPDESQPPSLPEVQSGLAGFADLNSLRRASLLHDLGHTQTTSGSVAFRSGCFEAFEEAFLRVFRNTVAHSLPSRNEEEKVSERIKATSFLSSLYRKLKADERAVMRLIYNYL